VQYLWLQAHRSSSIWRSQQLRPLVWILWLQDDLSPAAPAVSVAYSCRLQYLLLLSGLQYLSFAAPVARMNLSLAAPVCVASRLQNSIDSGGCRSSGLVAPVLSIESSGCRSSDPSICRSCGSSSDRFWGSSHLVPVSRS